MSAKKRSRAIITMLATVPMYWHRGLHSKVDGQTMDDPLLYLIHLHRVDYNICHSRHQQRVSQPWNQRDVYEGWGYQNWITNVEQFHHWFYNDSSLDVPIKVEGIPDYWKGVI